MLAALIAGGAALAGGALRQRSEEKNRDLQKEFAKNALQWKAADAEAAGISKLYGIGAPTTSFAPVSVGGMGASVADAGQHIGRAIQAQAGPTGRAGQIALELATAQLEGVKVDNEIKRAELLSRMKVNNQPGQPPAILDSETTPLVPGQGNAALRLSKNLSPAGSVPHKSFGVNPEVDFYRTARGYAPMIPERLGEALESQPLAAAQWFIRNNVLPSIEDARKTFPFDAPEGKYWQFNPVIGEYELKDTELEWDEKTGRWKNW